MAAVSAETLECWLPTEFLTEEEPLMDGKAEVKPIGFRNLSSELLYELDSFYPSSTLGSAMESLLGSSPETESTDDEEFIAGFTRRMTQQLAGKRENWWVKAQSPKSTLNGSRSWSMSSNGSPKRVLSPPRTPFWKGDDTLELIYAATEQVARLKVSSEGNSKNCHEQERSFPGPAGTQNLVRNPVPNQHSFGSYSSHSFHGHSVSRRCQNPLLAESNCSSFWERQQVMATMQARLTPHLIACNQYQELQNRGRRITGSENLIRLHTPEALSRRHVYQNLNENYQHHIHYQVVPPHHSTTPVMRATVPGGPSLKRVSTGTGVFLPRQHGIPPESKRKSARSISTVVPEKLVQALNMNFAGISGNYQTDQSLPNNAFVSDNAMFLARRNALSAQQRNNFSPSHGMRLPQEWTY